MHCYLLQKVDLEECFILSSSDPTVCEGCLLLPQNTSDTLVIHDCKCTCSWYAFTLEKCVAPYCSDEAEVNRVKSHIQSICSTEQSSKLPNSLGGSLINEEKCYLLPLTTSKIFDLDSLLYHHGADNVEILDEGQSSQNYADKIFSLFDKFIRIDALEANVEDSISPCDTDLSQMRSAFESFQDSNKIPISPEECRISPVLEMEKHTKCSRDNSSCECFCLGLKIEIGCIEQLGERQFYLRDSVLPMLKRVSNKYCLSQPNNATFFNYYDMTAIVGEGDDSWLPDNLADVLHSLVGKRSDVIQLFPNVVDDFTSDYDKLSSILEQFDMGQISGRESTPLPQTDSDIDLTDKLSQEEILSLITCTLTVITAYQMHNEVCSNSSYSWQCRCAYSRAYQLCYNNFPQPIIDIHVSDSIQRGVDWYCKSEIDVGDWEPPVNPNSLTPESSMERKLSQFESMRFIGELLNVEKRFEEYASRIVFDFSVHQLDSERPRCLISDEDLKSYVSPLLNSCNIEELYRCNDRSRKSMCKDYINGSDACAYACCVEIQTAHCAQMHCTHSAPVRMLKKTANILCYKYSDSHSTLPFPDAGLMIQNTSSSEEHVKPQTEIELSNQYNIEPHMDAQVKWPDNGDDVKGRVMESQCWFEQFYPEYNTRTCDRDEVKNCIQEMIEKISNEPKYCPACQNDNSYDECRCACCFGRYFSTFCYDPLCYDIKEKLRYKKYVRSICKTKPDIKYLFARDNAEDEQSSILPIQRDDPDHEDVEIDLFAGFEPFSSQDNIPIDVNHPKNIQLESLENRQHSYLRSLSSHKQIYKRDVSKQSDNDLSAKFTKNAERLHKASSEGRKYLIAGAFTPKQNKKERFSVFDRKKDSKKSHDNIGSGNGSELKSRRRDKKRTKLKKVEKEIPYWGKSKDRSGRRHRTTKKKSQFNAQSDLGISKMNLLLSKRSRSYAHSLNEYPRNVVYKRDEAHSTTIPTLVPHTTMGTDQKTYKVIRTTLTSFIDHIPGSTECMLTTTTEYITLSHLTDTNSETTLEPTTEIEIPYPSPTKSKTLESSLITTAPLETKHHGMTDTQTLKNTVTVTDIETSTHTVIVPGKPTKTVTWADIVTLTETYTGTVTSTSTVKDEVIVTATMNDTVTITDIMTVNDSLTLTDTVTDMITLNNTVTVVDTVNLTETIRTTLQPTFTLIVSTLTSVETATVVSTIEPPVTTTYIFSEVTSIKTRLRPTTVTETEYESLSTETTTYYDDTYTEEYYKRTVFRYKDVLTETVAEPTTLTSRISKTIYVPSTTVTEYEESDQTVTSIIMDTVTCYETEYDTVYRDTSVSILTTFEGTETTTEYKTTIYKYKKFAEVTTTTTATETETEDIVRTKWYPELTITEYDEVETTTRYKWYPKWETVYKTETSTTTETTTQTVTSLGIGRPTPTVGLRPREYTDADDDFVTVLEAVIIFVPSETGIQTGTMNPSLDLELPDDNTDLETILEEEASTIIKQERESLELIANFNSTETHYFESTAPFHSFFVIWRAIIYMVCLFDIIDVPLFVQM